MDLPVGILEAAPIEPILSVDGTFASAARGLNLSHWPGNTTPRSLRHDLSTGCALRFALLPSAERERLAAGATAIVNNHYDTDGVLALFATRHPERALPRAERLLAAAAAGDFFRFPDWKALALDAVITGLADRELSPWRKDFERLDERARYQRCLAFLLENLPDLLDGDLTEFRELWQPVLDDARMDLDDLVRAERRDHPELDLAVWTAVPGSRSSRPGSTGVFDPGRHALFGATNADRTLAAGPGPDGTTYRLVFSTLSWFDLETERRLPRPDLAALAARLNALEGTTEEEALAWRAQAAGSPAPELWFGGAAVEGFAEHNQALAPSRLATAVVERTLHEIAGCPDLPKTSNRS